MLQPMLAHSLNQKDVTRFASNEKWRFEQKLNGHRALMHVTDNDPIAVGRNGAKANQPPSQIMNAFRSGFDGEWILDGELMLESNEYHVFDLLKAGDFVSISDDYDTRREVLEQLFQIWEHPDCIKLLPSYTTLEGKMLLWETVVNSNCEGIMVKDRTAAYVPGKRSKSCLKCKLYKSADVVVIELWRAGKSSMAVGVYDDAGKLTNIGSCTMTADNLMKLSEGDVVELKYLYLGAGNRLYQPAFLRSRPDRDPQSCKMDQLVFVNKEVVLSNGK